MINREEKKLIRELAKQTKEISGLDVNQERQKRIKDMHSLKQVRPPVWIDEIPWHEMNIDNELTLCCQSEEAKGFETHFRRILYRWKHLQADMVVEPVFYVSKNYRDSGHGIGIKEVIIRTDPNNPIVSHRFDDQLDTEEKIESLKLPVIEANPQADREKLELAADVLDGIMPVKLRGHAIYYSPWDDITFLRGVENCYMDMGTRPDFIHKTIGKFTEIYQSRYNQMEMLGLLDFNISGLHCTPPYTDDLPAGDWDGGKVRFKDVWFRGAAQLFGSVSPAMQDEFDLQYMKPLMSRCGLAYYGCCEPLDRFIPYLKKIPNMRKIGVTPWANVRSCAEQIGNSYVMARKPNPAHAARFEKETVAKEIEETILAARDNKCPYDYVLKDISTVNGNPQNLFNWTNTVMEVIDRYYT